MPRVPRLPVIGDVMRRCRVPDDLDAVTAVGEEADPAEGGLTGDAVARLWGEAVSLYRSGIHPLIQVCVRREGAVVLDRSIGHARGNGPQDDASTPKVVATTQTPSVVYSTSKAITAFVIHLLAERGRLDIADPVAQHVPGYERHGKDAITIGHVLSHRSGVPNLPREAFDVDVLADPDALLEYLLDARPSRPAGKGLAYHAVSGGFILAEVVRHVTGRSIREVLAGEVLDPLGFRWTGYGVPEAALGEVALSYVTGPPTMPPLSNLLTRALGVPLDELVESCNDPRFLTGIVPAANIVSNASELSRFFELLRRGGELDGVRVVEPATIRRALEEQSRLEVDYSLGFPTRFSYGFMLGAQRVSLYGPDTDLAFGHLGFTNIMAWADPERALSAAIVTSGKPILYPELLRWLGLIAHIEGASPKVDSLPL